MSRLVLILIFLSTAACNPLGGTRTLGKSDCHPRKLSRLDACSGEDTGFQECRLYFRASGVPNRAWCEALRSVPPLNESTDLPACDFTAASAWKRVSCATYQVSGDASCFGCVIDEPGGDGGWRTYVYAYNRDCTAGLELVTCNFDATEAAQRLGGATL